MLFRLTTVVFRQTGLHFSVVQFLYLAATDDGYSAILDLSDSEELGDVFD